MHAHLRRTVVILLALAAVLVVLSPPGPRGHAEAAGVPTSLCARYDAGVARGVCVRDARGGLYWLGTLRGYDGVEIYCIDYRFATRWGVRHRRTVIAGSLPTSIGGRVGEATVAALNQVIVRHPADRVDDTTAAAIGLIIRQVMGDVRRGGQQTIPGGLTVGSRVKDVGFVPAPVIRRARAIWDDARVHRGPWTLRMRIDPGPDGQVVAGERVTVIIRGRNGSGNPQAMEVVLRYRGFHGAGVIHLGPDGLARVRVRAPAAPGTARVTARVDNAPGTRPTVIRPDDWAVNPRPGSPSAISQRGLVGRQDVVVADAVVTTRIVKARPRLVTQVSSQQVHPGATIHDTVVVSGSDGRTSTFTWSLLGPVAPVEGRCPDQYAEEWRAAPVVATGTVTVRGDGTYRTPDHVVTAAQVGCLTYTEAMPGTSTSLPAVSPPGIAEETTLVTRPRLTPCVSTVVSRQQALVGSRLHDTVRIGCIGPEDRVRVAWTLHGPVAPRAGLDGVAGCRRIPVRTWLLAPVAATGAFSVVGPGLRRTRGVVVRAPGCYTYSESVPATATTDVASSPPGLVTETALVARPPLVSVPEVPTGPVRPGTEEPGDGTGASRGAAAVAALAARAGAGALAAAADRWEPRKRSRPSHLRTGYRRPDAVRPGPGAGTIRIPRLRIAIPVERVGLHAGVMAIPDSPQRAGWLGASASAGDVTGSSVVAGHVSDRRDRPGPLARLGAARPGDRITWIDALGRVHRFRVTALRRHARAGGLPARVFRTDGPHVLHLITCAGRTGTPGGGFHYRDNLVVTARVAR